LDEDARREDDKKKKRIAAADARERGRMQRKCESM
jgi:hypothetical protein